MTAVFFVSVFLAGFAVGFGTGGRYVLCQVRKLEKTLSELRADRDRSRRALRMEGS